MKQTININCPNCNNNLSTIELIMPDSSYGNYRLPFYCTTCDVLFNDPNNLLNWMKSTYNLYKNKWYFKYDVKWIKQGKMLEYYGKL